MPQLSETGSPGDLLRGFTLPVRAFVLIFRTPRLLVLSLLCAAVTSFTLIAVAFGAWRLGASLAERLIGAEAGWQHVASIGLGLVFALVLFVVGALTAPNLLLAPLQDPLSEATEVRCGDFTAPPFSMRLLLRGTWEALWHTGLRLGFMLLGLVVLFPLNLIPGVGSAAWVAGSSVWTMFWLAVEHLSNPMARHLRPFSQVVTALRRRLLLSIGFGAALWLLLWLPVLNFFLMPVAVVAGTLLFRSLLAAGALPESQ